MNEPINLRWRATSRRKPAACPKCGSHELVPIVYGLPDEEMVAAAMGGIIELGGDVVIGEVPAWRCTACKERFGKRDER